MATATSTPAQASDPAQAPVERARGDQLVEFIGIDWEGYEALLKVQGEKSRPQMIYLDGDLLLMSPSNIHERLGDRLSTFVRVVVEGLDIPCEPTRETTFRRHDQEVGVQPDDSFSIANFAPIAAKDGKEEIDLDVDPPPDLVVEVVHTHAVMKAVEVLRRLGVPEVWVCKKEGLRILIRGMNGQYTESQKSLSFPFLSAAEIFDGANRPGMASMTLWVKELRRWVQEVLVSRVPEQGGRRSPAVPGRRVKSFEDGGVGRRTAWRRSESLTREIPTADRSGGRPRSATPPGIIGARWGARFSRSS